MAEFIPDLIKCFVAGVIGVFLGWFAHLWSCRRDAHNRISKAKDDFFSVLADQKAELDSLSRQEHKHFNPNEDAFLKESVKKMTDATYRVKRFVTDSERLCLSKVLKEYQSHKEQYTGLTRTALDKKSGVSFVQRLQSYMERFDDCISK